MDPTRATKKTAQRVTSKKAVAKKAPAKARGAQPAAVKMAPTKKVAAKKTLAKKVPAPARSAPKGTKASPWHLRTPPGSAAYVAYQDDTLDPPALVVKVGTTELRYHLRAIADLHKMLKERGDWVLLGGADEQKPAAEGSVEAWARDPKNPVKGWYGLKRGLRGRFGVYVPPVMEALRLAEVTHDVKNNKMRTK